MARTPKVSVKSQVRAAQREDQTLRRALSADTKPRGKGTPSASAVTLDSFNNFAHKLGVGADNPLTGATYGFNPITRNRTLLEWIHRGSWIGGLAVDVVADDMTRAGIEFITELPPDDSESMDRSMTSMGVWHAVNETIRWGRLYGGAVCVAMVDGQDMRTPLRIETVGRGEFKGLLCLDRWMLEPHLEDLVTDYGPSIGLPRWYRVTSAAPALRGVAVHHSRVVVRHVGVSLPYQQKLMENLWGISVLERLYDRMIAFDSASTGAAQLVYKSYLRTLSVNGLRDIVAAGGAPLSGLTSYVDMMRRFQSIEGITVIDGEDKFDAQAHSAFSGLSDALVQFGQQLSGALQIPLVRLFGQSPAGLNSTGESDLRMYYDNINQLQMQGLHEGMTKVARLTAQSEGIRLPPNFAIGFKPLWQLKPEEKSNIAKTNSETVNSAYEGGLIGRKTALKELRQSSKVTGTFTNVTTELIESADDEVQDPPEAGGGAMPGMPAPPAAPGGGGEDDGQETQQQDQAGSQGQTQGMDQSPVRRKPISLESLGSS